MLFVALTILSSVLVSVIIRVSEGGSGNRIVVAAANYVVAALLSLAMVLVDGSVMTWEWVPVGMGLGIGFVAGFLLMMKGIRAIGIAIPSSAARLSMLIPVSGSIVIFGEHPTTIRIVGIALGIIAFSLLGASQRRRGTPLERDVSGAGAIVLVLLFATVGTTDLGMKTSLVHGADNNVLTFLIFATAAVICWGVVAVKRLPFGRRELAIGSMLGVPNFSSVLFLLLALRRIDASTVFPIVSSGAVVLVTLVGALFWHERPSRAATIGLTLAAIAVALLA